MNWTLLRKDLRLFRIPLIAGLLLLLPVYSVAVWRALDIATDDFYRGERLVQVGQPGTVYSYHYAPANVVQRILIASDAVIPAAVVGLCLTAMLAAVFGGMAFAAERRDRSAEFVAMLPLPRWRIALSKLLAALPCLLVPAAVHGAVLLLSPMAVAAGEHRNIVWGVVRGFLAGGTYAAALTVMLFGMSWMLSAVLDSPGLAASTAVAIAAVMLHVIITIAWRVDAQTHSVDGPRWQAGEFVIAPLNPHVHRRVPEWVAHWTNATAVTAGIVGLLGGTAIYVRRVAP